MILVVLSIIGGILIFYIIPHFIASFYIFKKYFGVRPIEVIDNYFLKSKNYESVREILISNKIKLESLEHTVETIKSIDNIDLVALYFPNNSDKTIIFFHGHHANPTGIFAYIAMGAIQRGYNILIVNQRAHYYSGGKYSTFGYYEQEDVISWTTFLKDTYKPKQIFLYGMSMGGTSIALASPRLNEYEIKGMVIESAYPSLPRLVKQLSLSLHVPGFLFLWTIRIYTRIFAKFRFNSFDTVKSLKNNKVPTLFVHGTNDDIAIEEFLNDNYCNCSSEKKDKYIIQDGHHAIAVTFAGEEALNRIFSFYKDVED